MRLNDKFDVNDRCAVVDWIQQKKSIRIEKKSGYRQLFQDADGRLYLVLGAYAEWHGVPEAILNMSTEELEDGVLITARRHPHHIEVFEGELTALADSKGRLNCMSGKYDFHTVERSDQITVEGCTYVILDKLVNSRLMHPKRLHRKRNMPR